MTATTATLAAVTATGLASGHPAADPLDPPSWSHLCHLVAHHRLQGLLVAAIQQGDIAVTAEQADAAAELHLEAMVHAVGLERELVRLSLRLRGVGIQHRVLKGPAVAHTAYADPALRVFGDLDLLVDGADMDRALAELSRAGFRPTQPRLRPGFDAEFGKSVSLANDEGLEVDLHRTLVMGPYGLLVDESELLAVEPAPLRIAGHQLPTLSLEQLLLHACYTAGIADIPARWVTLRDLAELLLTTDVDTHAVRDLAGRFDAHALVAWAVIEAWDRLALADSPPLVAWARRHQPSPRDLRWRHAHTTGGYAPLAWASLSALPRLRDRVRFARALLAPSRSFLRARDETRMSWALRGARTLRRASGATP